MNRVYACLTAEEMIEAIEFRQGSNYNPNPAELYMAGFADLDNDELVLYNRAMKRQIIHFSAFEPSGDGTTPDFTKFEITDYGYTLKFGEYEAASDSLF